MNNVLLEMRNIHKTFPGVYALKDVNFDLKYGEVHAILGENGAGKSTLIKVLAGIYEAEKGQIFIDGKQCNIKDVKMSQSYGISVIHQELCLVPHMTVAENIFLGREPVTGRTSFVNFKEMNAEAQKILNSVGLNIESNTKVYKLSVAQQQLVEIAKALSVDARILIMDEPTSSLTNKEVEMLFKTINELKAKNISIIYISHRIEELFRITDRITVLRDGQYVGTKKTSETTKDELISMMVGRELKDLYKKTDHPVGETILEVKNLCKKNVLKNISFSLRRGEILGLSGLVGAGRTELMRAIFGVDSFDSGEIILQGKNLVIKMPQNAIENGIVLVSENRKEQGLILQKDVSFNLTLVILRKIIKFIHVDRKLEDAIVKDYTDKLSIKATSKNQLVKNLSGGNQQKVVIAKWLATNPKVLILDEPTRGVDVGAKAEIYSIIDMLASQGVGIIMVSSELPEIINMSDRVMVMNNGQITGILEGKQINQETIMHYATGGIKNAV